MRVQNEGTIVLLHPESDAEKGWLEEHIDREGSFQPFWPDRVVVEHRYKEPILQAMAEEGFEMR